MNLEITYSYKDPDKSEVLEQFVLEGNLTDKQIDFIISNAYEGVYFIPERVGLVNLNDTENFEDKDYNFIEEPDENKWHVLKSVNRTERPPTKDLIEINTHEFFQLFKDIVQGNGWEEEGNDVLMV